jgi:uncharacterized protein
LFREAADAGDGKAAAYLGDGYYFGHGLPQDKTAAEKWFAIGARRHDPVAAFNLASLLFVERDHPHDLPRAAKLLRTSAAAGYVPALSSLGRLLVEHPELAHSPLEAQTALAAASEAGAWKSSLLLATIRRDGRGAARDLQAARYYFDLATLQGGAEAAKLANNDLLALGKQLSADALHAADSLASTWFAAHHQSVDWVSSGQDRLTPDEVAAR